MKTFFFLLAFAPLVANAQTDEGWKFALTPYVWLPNVNGTLKYGGGAPDVGTGPNNYLENLHAVLMLAGEARKDRWSVFTDFIYLDFEKEKGSSAAGNSPAQSSLSGVEWTLAGGYTWLQSQRMTLDAIAGVRTFSIEASSDYPLLGRSATRSTGLVDAIVGVRGRVRWGEGAWFTPYYLDAGAGSSKLTWQGLVGIGYGFKWGDLVLAQRTLFYDQGGDKLLQDFRFSGPSLGATFRF